MTPREKNWILRPYLVSALWTEEESTVLVTDTFCVLTSVIETAGTSYPKRRRHILTSVRYSGQVWSAQTVDNCYVKSHCCCTATSVTVRTQMSVPGEIVSDRLQKEICCLLEEWSSAVQCDACFMLWLYWVSAGGLYSMLCVTGM
jgi:hypothetical protein